MGGLFNASERRGFSMAGGPMVTFGGALAWVPRGEVVDDKPALAGYANRPSLLGIDLGACSVN